LIKELDYSRQQLNYLLTKAHEEKKRILSMGIDGDKLSKISEKIKFY
jgi:hypothetical protein